jgi:hypothetical protein
MKTNIIKCDKCGNIIVHEEVRGENFFNPEFEEISAEKNHYYYTISRQWCNGWVIIDRSCGADSTYQICGECFKKLNMPDKK